MRGAVTGVWGRSSQLPEERGAGAELPKKFCIFLEKNNLTLGLF